MNNPLSMLLGAIEAYAAQAVPGAQGAAVPVGLPC